MYPTKIELSRITSAFVSTRTLTIVVGLMLALAVAACGSSEDTGTPAAPTTAEVQKAVESAVKDRMGEQLTTADVQKIVDASAGSGLTASDVQKIVQESAGQQLTAADVQKIVDSSAAGQLTASDVQKVVNEAVASQATAPAPTAAPAVARETTSNLESIKEAASASQAAAQTAPVTAQGGPAPQSQSTAAGSPVRPAPVVPPSATTFRDYEQSRFVSSLEDSVSTFSLDTDRTSFQLALNWARSGYEVEPDSVRAEEWINAFDYGYHPPAHRDSFAISTDIFRHPLDDRKHLVRIGFQAPELQDDSPLNVTLVLDASGSMADGNRVDIAREAAESIRRSLRQPRPHRRRPLHHRRD